METYNKIVSFDDELLIRVDKNDNILGYCNKSDVHIGTGIMHRAFSIFILSHTGEVLLQQRSKAKNLWPLYWSNSCCSHPRKGETYLEAAHRRLSDELGIDAHLEFIYKFDYTASYNEHAGENELCAVFIGMVDVSTKFNINPNEIEHIEWFKYGQINHMIQMNPDQFTPWFLIEWKNLTNRGAFEDSGSVSSTKKAICI